MNRVRKTSKLHAKWKPVLFYTRLRDHAQTQWNKENSSADAAR